MAAKRAYRALRHIDDPDEILDAFLRHDPDRDYLIPGTRFRATLHKLGARLSDADLEDLEDEFGGRKGQVDYQRFMQAVFDTDAAFPSKAKRSSRSRSRDKEERKSHRRRAPADRDQSDSDVDAKGHSRTLKRAIRKKVQGGLDSNFTLRVELERAAANPRRGEIAERDFRRVLGRLRRPLAPRELEQLVEWLPTDDPRMVDYKRLWSALGLEFEDDDPRDVAAGRRALSREGEGDARRRAARAFRDFLRRPTRRGEQTGLDVVEGACRMRDEQLHGRTLGRLPPRALQEALHDAGLRLDGRETAGLAAAVGCAGASEPVNYLELLSRFGPPAGGGNGRRHRRRRHRSHRREKRDGWSGGSSDSGSSGAESGDDGGAAFHWEPLPGSLGEWLQYAAAPAERRNFHHLLRMLQDFERERGLQQRRPAAIGATRPTADRVTLQLGSALRAEIRFHVDSASL